MIVGVAIRGEDFEVYLPKPARHHDVIRALAKTGMKTPIKGEQGFIDDELGFVGRLVAGQIAQEAGQLLDEGKRLSRFGLFSEDVW